MAVYHKLGDLVQNWVSISIPSLVQKLYKPRKNNTQDIIKMQVLNYLPHVTLVTIVTGCTGTTKSFVTKPLWIYIQDDSEGKVSILRGYNIGHCEKNKLRMNVCPVQIG